MKTVKTIRFYTKLISIFLILLLIFYIIPSTVYAEVVGAFSMDEESEETIENSQEPQTEEGNIYEYEGAVFEDENLREESVKHFRLEDGSYVAATYHSPVHYKDENGNWQDIDNALYSSGSDYTNSNARIKFSKKITGNSRIFALHDENRKITLSLVGAIKGTTAKVFNNNDADEETELQKLMSLEKLSSRVIYEDILDGTDLEYVATGLGIKENIIVKSRKDNYSYTFEIALNGLTATLLNSGDISLRDDSGEERYKIPAPIVYDSNRQYADAGLAYFSLANQNNGKYLLTVTVDSDWMNSNERVFPIIIDPEISSLNEYNMDTTVYEDEPDTSHGNDATLKVGNGAVSYVLGLIYGSWEYDYISKIQIGMKIAPGFNQDNQYIAVYPTVLSWDETLTWNQSGLSGTPPYTSLLGWNPLDYQYIDFDNTENDGWYYWDVTSVAYNWYVDELLYSGVCFAPLVSSNSTTCFASAENIDASTKPFIMTKYRNMNGIEDYWATESHSVGVAGMGSVNVANGNLTFLIPTLTTMNSLFSYTPTLVYNLIDSGYDYGYINSSSAYSYPTYTPFGFKMNITETVVKKTIRNNTGTPVVCYIHSDSDGTDHYFFQSSDENVFIDEDGLNQKISINENLTALTLTDDNKIVRTFSKMPSNPPSATEAWYLVSITDKNGNKLKFDFDENQRPVLLSIVPNGMNPIPQLKFLYNNDGRINVIYDEQSDEAVILKYSSTPTGQITTYGTKYLREVVFANSKYSTTENDWQDFYNEVNDIYISTNATAKYTYNENGALISTEDTLTGYKVVYGISGFNGWFSAVNRIDEYAGEENGQTVTFENSFGTRKKAIVRSTGGNDLYGDLDDICTNYSFDEMGRAVSIYYGNAEDSIVYGISFGKYQEQQNAKNNLKHKIISEGGSDNFFVNGDFSLVDDNTNIPSYWFTIGNVTRECNRDNYCMSFAPLPGTKAILTQYIELIAGDYTLSMPITSFACDSFVARVRINSIIGSDLSIVEEIALSKDASRSGDFAMTFTVPNHTNNRDKLSIAIELEAGTTVENNGGNMKIDSMMLSKKVETEKFNIVNAGGFEMTSIKSDGTRDARVSTFWTSDTSGSPQRVTTDPQNAVLKISGDITEEKYATQRIYSAPQELLDEYDEQPGSFSSNHKEYLLQAQITASNAAPCDDAFVGIKVEISYYQGQGTADVKRMLLFEAKSFEKSYICDYFATEYVADIEDTVDYSCVKYIDIYCMYSYQINGTVALFDNVALFECDSANFEEYYYNDDGLLAIKRNVFYEECYEYDNNRNISRVANNFGELTDYTYDSYNRIIKAVEYDYSTANGTSRYPFNAENPDSLIVKNARVATEYVYDNFGFLTSECSYEVNDNLSPVENAKYYSQSYVYDTGASSRIFGALISATDTLFKTTEYDYDIYTGRLLSQYNVYDGTGLLYDYDELGNITSINPILYSPTTDSYVVNSDSANVLYYYNSQNRIEYVVTESTTYFFKYDAFGKIKTIKSGGEILASYTYNYYNGKVSTMSYGNDLTVEYEYNNLENISKVWYTYSDGTRTPVYEYEYTSSGQLYKVSDFLNERDTVYTYDTNKRLIGYAEYEYDELYANNSASLSYNDKGQLSIYNYKLNYTAGGANAHESVSYHYSYNANGSLNRIRAQFNAAEFDATYSYDYFDRVSGYILASESNYRNEIDYTYETSDTNTSSRIKTYSSKVNLQTAITYTYTYDGAGNITKIQYSTGEEIRYEYDTFNQLIREDNPFFNETYVYTYDNAGNILSKKTYNLTAAGATPVSLKNERNYGYANASWGDLLTSYWGEAITYDDIGNPLNYFNGSEMSFSWLGRELASVTNGNGTFAFKYNADGIRISKQKNSLAPTEYFLDGNKIVGERRSNELFIYLYDASGAPVGYQYRTDSYAEGVWDAFWYEKNVQGDIVAVYSDAGLKLVSYTYNAWGAFNAVYSNGGISTAASKNPFLYRGYYYDSDINLYYLNSRYYDFKTGRFISSADLSALNISDKTLENKNLFVYANNNSIKASVEAFIATSFCNTIDFTSSAIYGGCAFLYDVPLYDQGNEPLCWACCDLMIIDYHKENAMTQKQAEEAAGAWAKLFNGENGHHPITCSREHIESKNITSVETILSFLTNGPCIALYKNSSTSKSHVVVVTGVSLDKGLVYTNNPHGIQKAQTFEKFMRNFTGSNLDNYPLKYLCLIDIGKIN